MAKARGIDGEAVRKPRCSGRSRPVLILPASPRCRTPPPCRRIVLAWNQSAEAMAAAAALPC
jgi:hypothetical protein